MCYFYFFFVSYLCLFNQIVEEPKSHYADGRIAQLLELRKLLTEIYGNFAFNNSAIDRLAGKVKFHLPNWNWI